MSNTSKSTVELFHKDTPPVVEPAIFIIFGITGDLAQRRLLPALYHLLKDDLLHENTEIIGVSRRHITADELLNRIELCVLETDSICDPDVLEAFRKRLRMVQLDPLRPTDYDALRDTLEETEKRHGVCMNRLFYLSIPPQVYEPVIKNLGERGLNVGGDHKRSFSRLLVEKPFGYDLISAQELIERTAQHFHENQVFRIDHYLAKETVQNILVFRERNPIFAELWNNRHITKITINMLEQIGIEGRQDFYDSVGALRDVVQNHLLQLVALVTMELPSNHEGSDALHRAKETLLDAIGPVKPIEGQVYRAQYVGYTDAVANPNSATESYVSLTLNINNDRWRNVPITLTTGKALMSKETAIEITFSDPKNSHRANKLTFRIQPNEGIDIELTVKRPGFEDKIEIVQMDFSYRGVFNEPEHPDAYERVLIDAIRGDHSLFATSDEILSAWRILQPILDAWQQDTHDLIHYQAGSEGPAHKE